MQKHTSLTDGPVLSKIISLTTPLIVTAILQTTQSLVDMFWVGKLGSAAIAAVAMSSMVIMVLFTFAAGISTGTIALVARYVGAKDTHKASEVSGQSIILGALISVLIAIMGIYLTKSMLIAMGASGEVLTLGVDYLRILLLGGFTMFIMFLINAVMQGAGDTVTPMKLMVLANVINIALNPLMIFGIGFPKMGVSGSALSTVVSQAIAMGIGWALLYGKKSLVHVVFGKKLLNLHIMKNIIKIGLPTAFQMLFRSMMGVFLIGIVAWFGVSALAAYGVGVRLQMIMLMPSFAFGGAAATLVGQNIGAREIKRARKSAHTANRLNSIIIFVIAFFLFIFAEQVMRFFNSDKEVIALGVEYLRLTTPFYVFVGVGVVYNRALSGAGDTLIPMIITFFTLWIVQIPLAMVLAKHTRLGLDGAWYAMIAAWILNGILMLVWFEGGKWKERHLA